MPASRSTAPRPWILNPYVQDLFVALIVLIALVPTAELLMGHQASRMALTGAIVDQHTLSIDLYTHLLTVDYALFNDHVMSDKAPGQPLLVAPLYWIGTRLLGIPQAQGDPMAVIYYGNVSLWWLTLWSAKVPLALLAVAMRRAGVWITGSLSAGLVAGLGMACTSLLLPFGSVLFAHVMAALLGFMCWFVVRDALTTSLSPARLIWAGVFGGMAVVTEYTTAMVVIVMGLVLLATQRLRVAWYVLGGLPFVGVLGTYNYLAWGSPLSFSYSNSGSFSQFHEVGLFGIRPPDPVLLTHILVGERGLLLMTPICLVGFIGLVILLRHEPTRGSALISLVLCLAFIMVQAGWWSVTAGASPGPRYAVAGLPFLAIGVAKAWEWSRSLVWLGMGLGSVPMFLATWTFPLAQPTEPTAIGFWVHQAMAGKWVQTIIPGAPNGLVVIAMLVFILVIGGLGMMWTIRAQDDVGPDNERTALSR